jgi:hypothetical protein
MSLWTQVVVPVSEMKSFINRKKPPLPVEGACRGKFWLRLHTLTGYSLRSGQASFIQVTVTSAEVKDAAAARPFGLSAPEAAHGLAAAAQAE